MSKISMLGFIMQNWILTEMNSTVTVTINNILFFLQKPNPFKNLFNHKDSLQDLTAAMYSVYVVERAIHLCNFDLHDVAPPAKTYMDVGSLE